jgi:hypothetical protein
MDNILQEQITKTLNESPSGVNFVIYGPKFKNGEYLNDTQCLIFGVEKKLPLSELNENELIPDKINLDGTEYKTDVVESQKIKRLLCYESTAPEVQFLRSRVRPLSGGLEISPIQSFESVNGFFNYWVGTLGFLAIDNVDNILVGVTNGHVMVKDFFFSNEKNSAAETTSIFDQKTFSGLGTFQNKILQFGSSIGNVNFTSDSIGTPKRYVPISSLSANRVDGALFTINQNTVNSFSAAQALSGTFGMPFCTTAEINQLQSNAYPIYSVGRTTGPKGPNCPLVVYGYGSVVVDYYKQGNEVSTTWQDTIFFKYPDDSYGPILGGDSGSALIANINGTYKIAGLVFAGNNFMGVASRIDRVVQELNISPWNGGNVNYISNNPTVSKIYRPPSDTRTSIVHNGRTYFLAGCERTSTPITNA